MKFTPRPSSTTDQLATHRVVSNLTRRGLLRGIAAAMAVAGLGTSVPSIGFGFGPGTAPALAAGAQSDAQSTPVDNPIADRFNADHHLMIGTDATNVVMEYRDPNDPTKLRGFDIEMIDAMMQHFNVPYEFKVLDFSGLIAALQGKQIDAITSSMFATQPRMQVATFISYLQGGTRAIVQKGNPNNIQSMDDLCGLSIAGLVGGVETDYLLQQNDACTAEGKPAIDVQTYQNTPAEFRALDEGRAVGALADASEAPVLLQQYPNYDPSFFLKSYPIGVGVLNGDDELTQFFLTALTWYHDQSGDYEANLQRNNISADLATAPQVLTAG